MLSDENSVSDDLGQTDVHFMCLSRGSLRLREPPHTSGSARSPVSVRDSVVPGCLGAPQRMRQA